MRLQHTTALYGALVIIFVVFGTKSVKEYKGIVHKYQTSVRDNQGSLSRFRRDSDKLLDTRDDIHIDSTDHNKSDADILEYKYNASCPFQIKSVPKPDIQMLELYKSLNFTMQNGGVWTEGFDIEVDEREWDVNNTLKVFVVPHSHNDPGWVKTFEVYYEGTTRHILNNMLIKLPEDPRRKFIWAEISYFSLWWNDLENKEKESVKKLLENNQLEIVTGGWVMNDEANSHWISILHQLTEGHQWLQKHVNYTPSSSWSIDPFGLGLTQPVLLRNMGLENLLVQRVHHFIKKHLASKQELEFRWSQLWDGTDKTAIFTHVMPFRSYAFAHACGPNPNVCRQFDFDRVVISKGNVAERAKLLLDQYRKKSKLYKTNVVIAPLGSDFSYNGLGEWDAQYQNYQSLFDYLNSNPNLNVEAKFGTLSDYFAAVRREKDIAEFPILTGDFFTYSDELDHYWSGYYTTRPFYKNLDRVLLSYIKAAETIQALAYIGQKTDSVWIENINNDLEDILSIARQSLSLFQHHDGITGTSKDWVVANYGEKLLSAIKGCQHIIQICAHTLLSFEDASIPTNDFNYYYNDDVRHYHEKLSEHHRLFVDDKLTTKQIIIFNPLTFTRQEVVTFHVSTPFIEVMDFQGKRVICQVSPHFEYTLSLRMSLTKYQLSFIAILPALGLVSYKIRAIEPDEMPTETRLSIVRILNHHRKVIAPNGFNPEVSNTSTEFTLKSTRTTATFSKVGLLKTVKFEETTFPINLDFAKYNVYAGGAYLFFPRGNPEAIKLENHSVYVVEGPIMSFVTVGLRCVHHTVILYNSPGADGLGVEVQNIVTIQKTNNFELVMRLSSQINSSDEFFTDVNGYQIVRRKRFKKLPLQANFYPMATMAYIEDHEARLSISTSTPLGCSSLSSGQIEIMLDRTLDQDDNLGLYQAIKDNRPTRLVFRILIEKRNQTCSGTVKDHPAGFPTVSAYVASQTLLNPLIRLIRIGNMIPNGIYNPMKQDFGVDFSVPTIKTNIYVKGKYHMGLVVHRQFLDVCFSNVSLQFALSDGTVNITALISLDSVKIYKSTLSFLSLTNEVNILEMENLPLCPMEMQAFVIINLETM